MVERWPGGKAERLRQRARVLQLQLFVGTSVVMSRYLVAGRTGILEPRPRGAHQLQNTKTHHYLPTMYPATLPCASLDGCS
jgi:hypothetical protein